MNLKIVFTSLSKPDLIIDNVSNISFNELGISFTKDHCFHSIDFTDFCNSVYKIFIS